MENDTKDQSASNEREGQIRKSVEGTSKGNSHTVTSLLQEKKTAFLRDGKGDGRASENMGYCYGTQRRGSPGDERRFLRRGQRNLSNFEKGRSSARKGGLREKQASLLRDKSSGGHLGGLKGRVLPLGEGTFKRD